MSSTSLYREQKAFNNCTVFRKNSAPYQQMMKMMMMIMMKQNRKYLIVTRNLSVSFHAEENKKAQLTQGLRATAPYSKMAASCHLGFYRTSNSAIRSADTENPCLEPNMEWIGSTVCEIFAFKLYCDLEIGVQGHSRSSKAIERLRLYICLP